MNQKVYRWSHGHYGGKYVEIPEEHFPTFKRAFKKGTLPRKIKTIDVMQAKTIQGEEAFFKKFPWSRGKIREMYFADRSKGLKRLEDLLGI